MRTKPHAFLRLGDQWINMAQVTDIHEVDGGLRLHLTSLTARLAGRDDPRPVTVSRQITLTSSEDLDKMKQWLLIHDED